MRPRQGAWAFNSSEYTFELKWDGLRALASRDRGVLRVTDRNGGDLLSLLPELAQFPVPEGVVLDGEVVALEVSRDGARALLALATANGPRVTVLGIQRDADLVPVAFGPAYDLEVSGSVVDVAWVDGSHVAVLWRGPETTQVSVLALGGPAESLGEIDGAVAIVGGNRTAGLRVLLEDQTVRRPSEAGGWRDTGLTASFLGTQQ